MAVPGAGCHEYNGSHRETATRGRRRADSDPVRPGRLPVRSTDGSPAGKMEIDMGAGRPRRQRCPSVLTRRTARFFAPWRHRPASPPPGVCRAYDLHSYQKEIAKNPSSSARAGSDSRGPSRNMRLEGQIQRQPSRTLGLDHQAVLKYPQVERMYVFHRHVQIGLRAIGANIRVTRDDTGEAAFMITSLASAGKWMVSVAVNGRCISK